MSGGGSQPAPKTYSPMEQAQGQILVDNANAERQRLAAEEQRRRDQAELLANQQRTAEQANSLYSQGQQYGQSRVGNLGYDDTYGLYDTYNNMLGVARNKVPDTATNVGSYFDYDNMFGQALNQVQGAQQTRLDNQYRNLTPVGWQQSYFADTADDDILNAIMGEQYGQTFDTLDAARARGQLSQGAFDNSLRALDQKKLAANSTLQDIGLGVLGGYRNELGGIAQQYNDQVTNYKLGQNLDLGQMTAAKQQRANELGGRMQGDIYRALGDTQLFSPDALMARGGSMAGMSNNPLRNAFRDQVEATPERTTGTTGVF